MNWSIIWGVLSGILSAGAIASLAAISNYYFSNKKDEKNFIRTQKMEIYIGLMSAYKKLQSMHNQRNEKITIEQHKNIVADYDFYQFKLALFAPKKIIKCNKKLQSAPPHHNHARLEEELQHLMRKDLGVKEDLEAILPRWLVP